MRGGVAVVLVVFVLLAGAVQLLSVLKRDVCAPQGIINVKVFTRKDVSYLVASSRIWVITKKCCRHTKAASTTIIG